MKRSTCERCTRPIQQCFCAALIQINHQTEVVILQHPKEVKHPFNTARIFNLCSSKCQIIVGEDFSLEDEVNSLIKNKACALMFPGKNALALGEESPFRPEVLFFLDGTWRKCRKILHLSSNLKNLPRLQINNPPPSRYQI